MVPRWHTDPTDLGCFDASRLSESLLADLLMKPFAGVPRGVKKEVLGSSRTSQIGGNVKEEA